jgi:hypothetical protein
VPFNIHPTCSHRPRCVRRDHPRRAVAIKVATRCGDTHILAQKVAPSSPWRCTPFPNCVAVSTVTLCSSLVALEMSNQTKRQPRPPQKRWVMLCHSTYTPHALLAVAVSAVTPYTLPSGSSSPLLFIHSSDSTLHLVATHAFPSSLAKACRTPYPSTLWKRLLRRRPGGAQPYTTS